MKITAISPQKRKSTRMNLFLDGQFAFSIDLITCVKLKLRVGQEVSQEERDRIIRENELHKWHDRSLKLISLRPRSEHEMRNFLAQHEVGESTTQLILAKLKTANLINDREFVEWFTEQRKTWRPKGRRALHYELQQKGISPTLLNEVLSREMDQNIEVELAKKLVTKKIELLKNHPEKTRHQKIAAFLQRRGFSWEVIKQALERRSSIYD